MILGKLFGNLNLIGFLYSIFSLATMVISFCYLLASPEWLFGWLRTFFSKKKITSNDLNNDIDILDEIENSKDQKNNRNISK